MGFSAQGKAWIAPHGHSLQASRNAALRPETHVPSGLFSNAPAAALHALPMEQPLAAPCALQPAHWKTTHPAKHMFTGPGILPFLSPYSGRVSTIHSPTSRQEALISPNQRQNQLKFRL